MSTTRKPLTTSTLAATAAIIVSFASLFIAWRQSVLIERQLAASVWPSLAFESSNAVGDPPSITMGFRNAGIGPARIRAFDLSYRGTPLKTWWELLASCCGRQRDDRAGALSSQVVGRVLAPGQSFFFLGMERTAENEKVWQKLSDARLHFVGHVCYCSALDDCWSLDINQAEPTPVPSCKEAAKRPQYNSW